MKNTTPLDASVLLSTPPSRARDIFGGDEKTRKSLYRRLISQWHPDHSKDPKAHEVFIHLARLFQAAEGSGASDTRILFKNDAGKQFAFTPQSGGDFEIGQWYRGNASAAYLTSKDHLARHLNFQKRAQALRYATPSMKAHMSPCMPTIHSAHTGPNGQLLIVKRDPEGIRLLDLIAHIERTKKPLDPRHAAWIIGSLHNIACYLDYQKIAHHGIIPANIWINPALHRTELLGGWFHALSFGERINSLPAQSMKHAPRAYLDAKTASGRLDLECIRALGRTLFGDPSGMRMHSTTPSALIDALHLPAHGSAIEEYERWQQALLASFGPPKFVEMKLHFQDIYTGE